MDLQYSKDINRIKTDIFVVFHKEKYYIVDENEKDFRDNRFNKIKIKDRIKISPLPENYTLLDMKSIYQKYDLDVLEHLTQSNNRYELITATMLENGIDYIRTWMEIDKEVESYMDNKYGLIDDDLRYLRDKNFCLLCHQFTNPLNGGCAHIWSNPGWNIFYNEEIINEYFFCHKIWEKTANSVSEKAIKNLNGDYSKICLSDGYKLGYRNCVVGCLIEHLSIKDKLDILIGEYLSNKIKRNASLECDTI